MSSLENLKKQAKQILRWHRERHWPVAVQIREHLPAWSALDDRQVMTAPFKLADAQALVARRAGFDSWEALKAGLPTGGEPAAPLAAKGRLLEAIPYLFVGDVAAACAYYVAKLGSEDPPFTYGSPPFFGEVKRDGVRLGLLHRDMPVFDRARQRIRDNELITVSLQVDDAKALYLEFQAAGASFYQPLKKEPWGIRSFILEDLDGNLIAFGGPGD